MADPLQELLAAGAIPSTTFPPTSRYAGTPVESWDPGNGEPGVPYLARRLCPRGELFALLYEVRISEGDRRDVLGYRHQGDAELWWQLADANGAVDPRELTDPIGKTIRVTLPQGVPGPPDG